MKYRKDKAGNEISILGLGCMRFKDKGETERMILRAIEGGVNFFDTAYIYPGSEITLGEILAKHDKRKDVYIATKLPLTRCRTAADFDRYFNEQLERLQTDYIDYYFMHAMSSFAQWEKLCEMGIREWIAAKKEAGQIRQVGFSFHSTYDDFIKILGHYDWEFCLIQYNYYDENYQAGRKGLEKANEKGIPVFIMEPLLGGRLATGLPKEAIAEFAKIEPARSAAQWAFWWLWNQPEVTMTLSGMNSVAIMEENLQSVADFRPLTEAEAEAYPKVVEIFKKSYKVPCTGCNYCIPCPQGINIPACFSAYNTSYAHGFFTGITLYATSASVMAEKPHSPRNCNNCGKCEPQCPQNIPIRAELKKVSKRFEKLPLKIAFAAMRRFMRGKNKGS
ncbi:MAG: aldo/keto reductase [Clostridiales bacterium]|jgi:predicted aldo/keto reductase-like oxidoreductase|nr:aldo/keto reductase [Clostridiales bacterium]